MRLAILGLSIALMSAAYAQSDTAPTNSTPKDTISLAVGQAHKFTFPQSFDRIDLDFSYHCRGESHHGSLMTLHRLAAGETIMTVMAGAKELYSATVVVGINRVAKSGYTAGNRLIMSGSTAPRLAAGGPIRN